MSEPAPDAACNRSTLDGTPYSQRALAGADDRSDRIFVMLSISERVEKARTYVLDVFELDANTVDVVIADWTIDTRDYLQVRMVVQNAIQLRVEVDPAGGAELLLSS